MSFSNLDSQQNRVFRCFSLPYRSHAVDSNFEQGASCLNISQVSFSNLDSQHNRVIRCFYSAFPSAIVATCLTIILINAHQWYCIFSLETSSGNDFSESSSPVQSSPVHRLYPPATKSSRGLETQLKLVYI